MKHLISTFTMCLLLLVPMLGSANTGEQLGSANCIKVLGSCFVLASEESSTPVKCLPFFCQRMAKCTIVTC